MQLLTIVNKTAHIMSALDALRVIVISNVVFANDSKSPWWKIVIYFIFTARNCYEVLSTGFLLFRCDKWKCFHMMKLIECIQSPHSAQFPYSRR